MCRFHLLALLVANTLRTVCYDTMKRLSPDELRQLIIEDKWTLKHRRVIQREFGDELLFEALFGAFTEIRRPEHIYRDQNASVFFFSICFLYATCLSIR